MTDEDVVALREGGSGTLQEHAGVEHFLRFFLAGQTGAPALQLNPASALDSASSVPVVAAEPGPASPLWYGASSSVIHFTASAEEFGLLCSGPTRFSVE